VLFIESFFAKVFYLADSSFVDLIYRVHSGSTLRGHSSSFRGHMQRSKGVTYYVGDFLAPSLIGLWLEIDFMTSKKRKEVKNDVRKKGWLTKTVEIIPS